ncbi:MAG TPA: hypothetical protein VN649_16945 [Ramlibacter sp.]|nr:hypothetical protein [Ramlibacter sp.]
MRTLLAPALLALLAGCAVSSTPNYDPHFGEAVREARQRMTLNPNAGSNPESINGMDGRASREAMVRYQDSFKAPPPVVNVINIGGALGGSGQ